MKPFALLALVMVASCGGDLYDPCLEPDDCDLEVADGCVTLGAKSWCTKLCEVDSDCPPGPDGERAICIPVDPAGSKVCSIP